MKTLTGQRARPGRRISFLGWPFNKKWGVSLLLISARSSSSHRRSFSPVLLALFLIVLATFTLTWTSEAWALVAVWSGGGGDTNWSTAANWNGAGSTRVGAPLSGDSLTFPSGASQLSNNNDIVGATFTITISGSGYTLAGTTITLGGTLTDSTASGSSTINLPIILSATRTFTITNAAETLIISGVMSGAGGLTKGSSGTLILSGANTYAGTTTISAGTLQLGAADVIPDGAGKGDVSVTGTLDLNTFSDTINGLSGGGTVDTVAGGTPTLTVGNNNATSTFSGVIKNTAGTLALTKTGSGTLTLSGANTYTGATTINAGATTMSSASASLGGATTVSSGATLTVSNSATFSSSTTVSGTLNVTAGTPTFTGAVTVNNGGTVSVTGGTPGFGAMTVHDGGAISLSSGANFNSTTTIGDGVSGTFTATATGIKTFAGAVTIHNGGNVSIDGASTFSSTTTIGDGASGTLALGPTTSSGLKTFTGLVTINSGASFSIDGASNFNATPTSITITGTFTPGLSSAKTFAGLVMINAGGTWDNSGNDAVTFAGNLTNHGTFTAGSGVQTFSGTTKTLSSDTSLNIPSLTVSGSLTNNLTSSVSLTVDTALAGSGTLTNPANATLHLGGAISASTVLDASAVGNTVIYDGTTQTVRPATFYDLIINEQGGSTATLSATATTTVGRNLTIQAGTLSTGSSTLNVNGALAVNSAATLTIAATVLTVTGTTAVDGSLAMTSTTAKTFTGDVTISGTGSWTQTSSAAVTFAGNLINNGSFSATGTTGNDIFSGAGKSISGTGSVSLANMTVSGSLTNQLTPSATLTVGSSSTTGLTVSGGATLTNGFTGIASTLNFGGNGNTITGALDASTYTNTVVYNGSAAQTVVGITYHHLTINVAGTATLSSPATVNGNLTVSSALSGAGTLTLSGTGSSTISGSSSIANPVTINADHSIVVGATLTFSGVITLNAVLTNNGTATLTNTAVALTGSGTWTQGGTPTPGTLSYGGSSIATALDASAAGNTVNYSGAAQTIKAATYHHLTLSGSGAKTAPAGTLTINGNYTNNATFTNNGGTVLLSGAAPQALSGTMTTTSAFNALTISNNSATVTFSNPATATTVTISTMTPPVQVKFNALSTYTFTNISFLGSAGNLIQLRSSITNTQWNLNVTGSQAVAFVDVEDSDATGNTIYAGTSSVNSGNNVNWDFTDTCNSNQSGNWTDPNTWVQPCNGATQYPGAGSTVFIQSGHTVTVTADAAAASITINSPTAAANGLSINTAVTLTVTNGITLTANATANAQTITMNGTGNITAASMTIPAPTSTGASNMTCASGATGTLSLSGALAITGNSTSTGAVTVGMLTCTLSAGSISITGGSNVTGAATVSSSTGTITTTGNITFGGTAGQAKFTSTGASTVNVGGNFGSSGTLTTGGTGTINFNGAVAQSMGSYTTYNHVTISNSAGVTLALAATVGGNLIVNGPLSGAGTLTLGGAGASTMTGSSSIANAVTISANHSILTTASLTFGTVTINSGITLINDGTATVSSLLSTGTWQQGTNPGCTPCALYYSGATIAPALAATNSGNTVTYTGSAQTVKVPSTSYYNLTISSTGGTTTATNTYTVNNNLTVNSGTVNVSTIIVTGSFTVASGATVSSSGSGNYNGVNTISGTFTTTTAGTPIFAGAVTVNNGGAISLSSGATFNSTTTIGGGVSGTFTISGATGTKTFNGDVTINNGGTWKNDTVNDLVTFAGNLTNHGTFTAGIGVQTFSGAGKLLSSDTPITIPSMTVSNTTGITNTADLTISTALSGAGKLTQGSGAALTLGGTSGITTLDASANGNTVIYNGSGAQTVKVPATASCTQPCYYHLTINKSAGNATLSSPATVNGNLTVSSTLIGAGTIILAGAGATIDGTGSIANPVTISADHSILSTANLTFSGIITLNALLTNNGAATLTNTAVALTGSGTWTQGGTPTPGTLSYGGSSIATALDASAAGNTVNYSGAAQTIKAATYHHLTLSGSGAKTAPAGTLTINGNYTNNATFTNNGGTVLLSGAAPQTLSGAMTGTGPTGSAFSTLIVSDASSTVTLGAAMEVAGSLTINSGTLADGGNQITGNSAGTFTMASGAALTLGSATDTVATLFPANFIREDQNHTAHIILDANSTVTYGSNLDQTISGTPSAYGHLILSGSGTKTAPGTLTIRGNYTNTAPATFAAGTGTVTFNGDAQQILDGAMTGASAFYNLTLTNTFVNGTDDPGCGVPFTPGIVFATDAAATNYTIATTTSPIRVQYFSGSTYTFTNINWTGHAAAPIFFRASNPSQPWLLTVTGVQIAVFYVNVARSNASGGEQIGAVNGTDCGNNTNWSFTTTSTNWTATNPSVLEFNSTTDAETISDTSKMEIAANVLRLKDLFPATPRYSTSYVDAVTVPFGAGQLITRWDQVVVDLTPANDPGGVVKVGYEFSINGGTSWVCVDCDPTSGAVLERNPTNNVIDLGTILPLCIGPGCVGQNLIKFHIFMKSDTGAAPSYNVDRLTLSYNPVYAVTSVSPASLPQNTTAILLINGHDLRADDTVDMESGGVPLSDVHINTVNYVTSQQLQVNVTVDPLALTTTPPNPRDVVVTKSGGGASATCLGCFTVTANPFLPPTVTAISPNAMGQGAQSQNVLIAGTRFVSGASVSFSSSTIHANPPATVVTSSQIAVSLSIDQGAPTGSYFVTVTNPGGLSGTSDVNSDGVPDPIFTITAGPRIDSVAPASVSQGATGVTLNISGANFQADGAELTTDPTTVALYHFNATSGAQANNEGVELPDSPGQITGTVGLWHLNNAVGTTTGTTPDTSGGGNTGTLNNFVLPYGFVGTGKFGNALSFNGTNNYVSVPTISIPTNITVEAWVYSANYGAAMMVAEKAPVNTQWELFFRGGLLRWRGGSVTSVDCPAPANNAWHHVAATQQLDPTTLLYTKATLYIDGSPCATGAVAAIKNGVGLINIGRYESGYYFNGRIDELAIYNAVLTPAQVTDHYLRGLVADAAGLNQGVILGPVSTAGQPNLNQALLFDGVDDYVSLDDPASVDFGAGDFTLEAWAKLSSTTAAGREVIIGKDNGLAGGRQFALMLDANNDDSHVARITYFTAGDLQVSGDTAPGAIADTNWYHHIAAGRSGGTFFLYIDGVAQNLTTTGTHGIMQTTASELRIGAQQYGGSEGFFPGAIDEVAISNVALSPAFILSHYQRGKGISPTYGGRVTFSGTGVTPNPALATFIDSGHLQATVDVASDALPGGRDVTVTNPGPPTGSGGSGTKGGALTITATPDPTSVTPSSLGQGATGRTLTVNSPVPTFAPGATVSFGNPSADLLNLCGGFSFVTSSSTINCVSPQELSSTGPIALYRFNNPDGKELALGDLAGVPDANLKALYHFDEGSGTTVADSSGSVPPNTGTRMVSRLYLHGAADTTAGLPTGEQAPDMATHTWSGANTIRQMTETIGAAQQIKSHFVSSIDTPNRQLEFVQMWASPPLAAQTIPGQNWNFNFARAQDDLSRPILTRVYLYVWRPGTASLVGTIVDPLTNGSTQNTVVSAEQSYQWTMIPGRSVTVQEGDRLVLEWWKDARPAVRGSNINESVYYDGTTVTTTNNTTVSSHATFLEAAQPLALSATWTTAGKFSNALSFDGVGDYVNVGNVGSGIKTVEFWINRNGVTAANGILELNGTATVSVTSGGVITTGAGFTSPTIYVDGAVTSALPSSGWHQVAIVTGTGMNASAVAFGRANSVYMAGMLDEVAIFNAALTSAQVTDHFSRSRATDATAGANHGVIIGPVSATGQLNQALLFDGANDVVNVGNVGSGIKTVEFWIKDGNPTDGILELSGTARLSVSSGTVTATGFAPDAIYVDGALTSTLPSSGWHHVAVVINAGVSASAVVFGRANTDYMAGLLDEVAIYTSALPATGVGSIHEHYLNGVGGLQLVSPYQMSDQTATSAPFGSGYSIQSWDTLQVGSGGPGDGTTTVKVAYSKDGGATTFTNALGVPVILDVNNDWSNVVGTPITGPAPITLCSAVGTCIASSPAPGQNQIKVKVLMASGTGSARPPEVSRLKLSWTPTGGVTITSPFTVNSAGTGVSFTVNVAAAAPSPAMFDVTVTNPTGEAGACVGCFAISSGPAITGVVPFDQTGVVSLTGLGQGATNRKVTITGTGFQSGLTVSFGDAGITNGCVYFSSTQINCTNNVSVGLTVAPGVKTVTVTNPDGGAATGSFTVNPRPATTTLTPPSATSPNTFLCNPNNCITLNGANYSNVGGTPTVTMSLPTGVPGTNGITVNFCTFDSATQLRCAVTISGADTGYRDVVVTNPDGGVGQPAQFYVGTLSATGGMVVYGEHGSTDPKFRLLQPDGTWGAQLGVGSSSGEPRWAVLRNSPLSPYTGKLAGILDINRQLTLLAWGGEGWSAPMTATSFSGPITSASRSFDLAYEQLSGDALTVYGKSGSSLPSYRTWDHASSTWSAEALVPATLNTASAIAWVRLVPRPGSNEILLLYQDLSGAVNALVWDGSGFGHEQLLTSNAPTPQLPAFDAAYVQHSCGGGGSNPCQAVVVVAEGNVAAPRYRTWDGAWEPELAMPISFAAAAGEIKSVKLAADGLSDTLAAAVVSSTGGQLSVSIWDGTTSSWETSGTGAPTTASALPIALVTQAQPFDLAWLGGSGSSSLVVSYGDVTPLSKSWTAAVGWSGQTNILGSSTLRGQYHLDETGSPLADSSGNGNALTLTSGATADQPGIINRSVAFVGGSASTAANPSTLSITGTALTMAAWVYPTAFPPSAIIVSKENSYAMAINNGRFQAEIKTNPGSGCSWSFAGGTPLTLNTWQHLAVTYDGAFMRLYVNGVVKDTDAFNKTGTICTSTNALMLGARPAGSFFLGRIDEVQVLSAVQPPLAVTRLAPDPNPISQDLLAGDLSQFPALTTARWNGFFWEPSLSVEPTASGAQVIGLNTYYPESFALSDSRHSTSPMGVLSAAPAIVYRGDTSASCTPSTNPGCITITGGNFPFPGAVTVAFCTTAGDCSAGGSGITVNNNPVTADSSTQLTVRTTVSATAAAGLRDIRVTNPSTGETAFGHNLVTVNPPPRVDATICGIVSNCVLGHGTSINQTVTITGAGFNSTSRVTISNSAGMIPASPITPTSVAPDGLSLTITITTIPAALASGARDVTVTNTTPAGSDTATGIFSIDIGPTVTSVNPPNPPNGQQGATALSVTVNGTGFQGDVGPGATVSFSGAGITIASDITFNTPCPCTTATFAIDIDPAAPVGNRTVTVTNPDPSDGGNAGSFGLPNAFQIIGPPVVTTVSPSQLTQGDFNRTVTINGNSFDNTNGTPAVCFDDPNVSSQPCDPSSLVSVGSVTYANTTTLTVNVAVATNAAAGLWDVTVTNHYPSGDIGTTGSGLFQVAAASCPDGSGNWTVNTGGTVTQGSSVVCTNITVNNGSTLRLYNTGGTVGVTLTATSTLTVGGASAGTIQIGNGAAGTASAARINALNMTVNANGTIDANGAGCGSSTSYVSGVPCVNEGSGVTATFGEGGDSSAAGGGAGYGGAGGAGGAPGSGGPGNTYPTTGAGLIPVELGSGGGHGGSGATAGGSGGGALALAVSGMLTVDGTIRSNGNVGTPGGTMGGGGGSGGAVYVVVTGNLAGAGTGIFQANGGNGGNGSNRGGGGGGGGRIAVYVAGTNTYAGALPACTGGTGGSGAGTGSGSNGTTNSACSTPFPTGMLPPAITGSGTCPNPGSLAYTISSSLECTGDLTVAGGAILTLQGDITLTVTGTIKVTGAGSKIVVDPLNTYVTIVATNLTVDAGAFIDATGTGCGSGLSFNASVGSGCVNHGTTTVVASGYGEGGDSVAGGGGGYGANGGSASLGAAGSTYGSAPTPIQLGSGGGNSTTTNNGVGGFGGGALSISISGTLTLDGTIRSNGANGTIGSLGFDGGGGGSGGAVYVVTGNLAGSATGLFQSKGGAGGSGVSRGGGGGGGGRIAVYYTGTDSFTVAGGTIACAGGTGGSGAASGTAGGNNTTCVGPTSTTVTTTLGNGTNPSNTTVAPGSTSQYLDQFTFSTNSTGDSVTALTVTVCNDPGCSSNTNDAAIASMAIWNNAMTIPYFSTIFSTDAAHNIGAATWNFSGGTPIPVGLTSAAYRVVVTFQNQATLDACGIPCKVLYPVTGRVTAFTSTNSQAGSDATSATITVDNLPPANAAWGSNSAGDAQVLLKWTNPTTNADSTPLTDFSQVVILRQRCSPHPCSLTISDAPQDGATYTATIPPTTMIGSSDIVYVGSGTAFTDYNVINTTRDYYYKIFSRDVYLNYSAGAQTGPLNPVQLDCSVLSLDGAAATNTLSADTSCTGTLTISNGAALTLQGDITLTVHGTLNVGTGSTFTGSAITVAPSLTFGFNRIVADNVTIDTGAAIHSDAVSSLTTGSGTICGNGGGGGGGYGGKGGDAAGSCTYPAAGGGGNPYGSPDLGLGTQILRGSKGANSSGGGEIGAKGGGAIRMDVGTLTVNGTISATGGDGILTFRGNGAGSGGSLYITAQTLTGSGHIEANGGNSIGQQGGAGGGGRVVVNVTVSNVFLGLIQATGGTAQNSGAPAQNGSVVVTGASGTGDCSSGAFIGAGRFGIYSDFICTGALTVSNGTTLILHGDITLTVSGNIVVCDDLTDCTSSKGLGTKIVAQPATVPDPDHPNHPFVQIVANNVANNMTVGAGASVQADGTGCDSSQSYDPGTAQCRSVGGGVTAGFGEGGDNGGGSNTGGGGGGGYGGAGGAGSGTGAGAGGLTYSQSDLGGGTDDTKIMPGSGGGNDLYNRVPNVRGGAGGGAIKIVLGGALTVNGTISANGLSGTPDTDISSIVSSAGGGSGGSLYLYIPSTAALMGSGQIQANGGDGGRGNDGGESHSGGGGGGRIVINLGGLGNPFPALTVLPGTGASPGGAGSAVLVQLDVPPLGLPAAIQPLTSPSHSSTSIDLRWTAVGDDGTTGTAVSYDLRYLINTTINDANYQGALQIVGEPTPAASGIQENFTVTGLNPNTTYCFAIKAIDDAGLASPLDLVGTPGIDTSTVCVTTDPADVTPPAAVNDLAVASVTNGSYTYTDRLKLTWTAVGDDGKAAGGSDDGTGCTPNRTPCKAAGYELRYRTELITDENFAGATLVTTAAGCGSSTSLAAPQADRSAECFIVTGLSSGVTYYFAIKIKDEVPNYSPINTNLPVFINIPADVTLPANVTPLTASGPTVNTVNLTFTSPGDDGTPSPPCPCGTPAGYIVKYSTTIITDQPSFNNATTFGVGVPNPAGQPETITVSGLSPGTLYYFAVEAVDEKGNQSGLGAVATATTAQGTDTIPPGQITDLRVISVTDRSVMLQWTAKGDDGDTGGGAAAAYDLRFSPLKIVPTSGDPGNGVTTIWFDDPALPPNQKIFQVTGEPLPRPPLQGESMTVDLSSLTSDQLQQFQHLVSNTNLFFAIRVIDKSGNPSTIGMLTNTNVSDPIDPACTGGAGSQSCNLRTTMRFDPFNAVLVSVPLQGPLSPTAIFGPLDGATDWCGPNDLPCLYRWISSGVGDVDPSHYYLMDPDPCSANCVEPGEGYYFFTNTLSVLDYTGTDVPTVTGDGDFVISGTPKAHFHYTLRPGMNLIGNPFKKNVPLKNNSPLVGVHILQLPGSGCTLGEMTFDQAAVALVGGQPIIDNAIYVWDGGTLTAVAYNDSVAPAVLKPWQGYEFFVKDATCTYQLLIPQP